jgi:hypothetical protein
MSESSGLVIAADRKTLRELGRELKKANVAFRPPPPKVRGVPEVTELVVAMGSAGVFTLVYNVVKEYLRVSKRKLTVKNGDAHVTMDGHTAEEEVAVIKALKLSLDPVKKPKPS